MNLETENGKAYSARFQLIEIPNIAKIEPLIMNLIKEKLVTEERAMSILKINHNKARNQFLHRLNGNSDC